MGRRKGTREAAVSVENLPKKKMQQQEKEQNAREAATSLIAQVVATFYVVKETIQQRSEFFSASSDGISLGQIRPQQLFKEETPISSSCPAAR